MNTAPYIIIGANDGIGGELTEQLLELGHHVVATARDASTITANSNHLETKSLDVLEDSSITKALSSYDEIAGLAYCVGSIDIAPFKAARDEKFIKSYELNVLGAIRALRTCEKALKKAKGSVVLFSTIAVQQGFTNHALISTAKGAVEGLTRSLAAEWAPHIRVNCIAPSLSDTPLAKPLTSSEAMAKSIAAMHPIPRLGTAEDSASMAAFLLGPQSGWITGQIMHIDGGRSALSAKG